MTHIRHIAWYVFSKEQETLILCGFIVSGCRCAKCECDGPNVTVLFFPVVGGKLWYPIKHDSMIKSSP